MGGWEGLNWLMIHTADIINVSARTAFKKKVRVVLKQLGRNGELHISVCVSQRLCQLKAFLHVCVIVCVQYHVLVCYSENETELESRV